MSVSSKWSRILPHLTVPIFLGPMAGAAGGRLAAEVSRAGGMGFIGGGMMTAKQLQSELDITGDILRNCKHAVGVGFLGWNLSKMDGKKDKDLTATTDFEKYHPQAVQRLDTALLHGVKAIWLGFGTPTEIVFWSRVIRARSKVLNRPPDGLALFVSVGSEEEARSALASTEADVLVAQGIEAGGHGLGVSPPIQSLVKTLQRVLANDLSTGRKPPLLIAAGGLSDGKSLASLMSLGLDGGVFGTRFLMTPESTYSDTRKKVLAEACGKDSPRITQRSMAFDEARNTLGWPAQVNGRGIVNATVEDFENGKLPMEKRQKRYQQAEKEDDPDRLIVWAGTGIQRMDAEQSRIPAYDTVKLLWAQVKDAMKGNAKL